MNECLVAIEQSVSASEQVTLEPALALVLAQNLHDLAAWRQEVVIASRLREPLALRGLEHGLQAVGYCFIGPEQPKIARLGIRFEHIPDEMPEDMSVAYARDA